MNKATMQKLVIAYTAGIISEETLSALEKCDIFHEHNKDSSSLGQFWNSTEFKKIYIYDKVVQKYFDSGYMFYGIMPTDINHALQLVLEHEVVHMITALQFPLAPLGHSKLFLTLAGFIFDHPYTEIEEVIND